MHKVTVYLTDELKDTLARASQAAGRSQAALIREGIELVVSRTLDAKPPLIDSGGALLAERVDRALTGFGEQ